MRSDNHTMALIKQWRNGALIKVKAVAAEIKFKQQSAALEADTKSGQALSF